MPSFSDIGDLLNNRQSSSIRASSAARMTILRASAWLIEAGVEAGAVAFLTISMAV